MPRFKGDPPAVRVYTVCDESKYLIVRNVPALGCGDELRQLFASYGEVEECKPMDAEDCEPFTDVFWIKFCQVNSARFAKRKLDEFVFLGNQLLVSYAPQYESLSDTKEKLEYRRKEILDRVNSERSKSSVHGAGTSGDGTRVAQSWTKLTPVLSNTNQRDFGELQYNTLGQNRFPITRVSSDKDYFPSQSMNQTVREVREKLKKIQSSADHVEAGPAKKTRVDNRRRI